MIELAQHIEVLLLENDCVIVPGLGGFVAHYTPAMRVAEENTFQTLVSEGVDANYMDMINYSVFGLIKIEFGD